MSSTSRFKNWVVTPADGGKVMCFTSNSPTTVVYVDLGKTRDQNCGAIAKTVPSMHEAEYAPLVKHVLGSAR